MSVLACNRNGCDNIMCDRYSDKYGYICWECYIELVGLNISPKEFMNLPKDWKEEEPKYDYDKIFPETNIHGDW